MFNPFIILYIVYIAVFITISYLIFSWVTRFLKIKQEQNDIFRELVKNMGNKDI